MLPTYVANPAAVIFGGGKCIDGGRFWKDGKRILGEGKTWLGLAGGTLSGMLVGWIQEMLVKASGTNYFPSFGNGYGVLLFALAFGALFGDSAKSFVKRRMNIERGEKSPYFMDQLDFVLGAWIFATILTLGQFWAFFNIYEVLVIIIITPALHRIVNIIGYKTGKKQVPW